MRFSFIYPFNKAPATELAFFYLIYLRFSSPFSYFQTTLSSVSQIFVQVTSIAQIVCGGHS
ncbi:hypothetical protein HMPREF0454_03334 [Hafnia alvei ATCC 51873]|uniref:Uncharacterized protein n=1 Tax=Hafnia alvei ATCC 51873 TaxID=1002364 RepID=G9Y9R5_HAFAL|nr:hypothetical protein HMPREF0454_03334 [Hafnia alvei ATCC 51873]